MEMDVVFYKFLMKLPNVELVHPSIPPDKIIKNSSMVITIASTAGQEAEAGMEMSALVNYVQPVHFHSFDHAESKCNISYNSVPI